MIEKIKQNSKQKNIENKNAEKNEKKPEEESSQEVIKVCRGGGIRLLRSCRDDDEIVKTAAKETRYGWVRDIIEHLGTYAVA